MLKRTKRRLHKRLNAWPKLLATQVIACLLACTTIVPANAQDLGLTEDEKTFIEEHPVIKVGGEVDWGPFDFVDEQGNYSGVANDYLNVISERTGLQFQVETHSFNELLNKLRAGDVDLIPAVFYSEERSRFYNFTTKYHQLAQYVFARDDAGVTADDDIAGKTAAIVRGFMAVDLLREAYPETEVVEYDSLDDAIDAVVTYRADLLFDSIATLNFTLRQKSITNIHPVFAIKGARNFDLFMASSSRVPELASIISKVIASINEEEKEAILSRWLGEIATIRPERSTEQVPIAFTEIERAWLEQHPVIRAHNEMAWPPFNFNRDGEPQGYSVDFMNLVAERAGLQLKYISGPSWNEFVEMIRSEELDVIINMTPTPDRQSFIQFRSEEHTSELQSH
jgi:ABC-type amino acid transport substrate-binding protein